MHRKFLIKKMLNEENIVNFLLQFIIKEEKKIRHQT